MSEVVNLADVPKPVTKAIWGHWTFDDFHLTITHEITRYQVHLERCTTSAKTLDWIAQTANKAWTSPEDVADLVRALDELIGLQENLCGGGNEHVLLDVREIITRRRRPARPARDKAPLQQHDNDEVS